MSVRRVARYVAGSIAVYVAMAACSAAAPPALGDDAGAAADALLDPVGEANAGPSDVATEQCNKAAGAFAYAEHLYPGRSVNDLARVTVVLHFKPGKSPIPGYDYLASTPLLRDGAAAANCSGDGYDSATFVLPQ